jgi:hypothetical protein
MFISLVALALIASDPQGVIATAPEGRQAVDLAAVAPVAAEISPSAAQTVVPHGLTTDQQIDRWLGERASGPSFDEALAGPVDDRKVHGEVGAGIGTGGYRDYSAWLSVPIGSSGRLELEYRQTKNALYPYRDERWSHEHEPFRDATSRADAWDLDARDGRKRD